MLTVFGSAGVSTRHSRNESSSSRDRISDSTDFTVNRPSASSCVLTSDSFLPARYQPTSGAGRVLRTSQALVNRWPSRSGPSVLAFWMGACDSSST